MRRWKVLSAAVVLVLVTLLTAPARTAVLGWTPNQRLFGSLGPSVQSEPSIGLGGSGGTAWLVAWTDERNSVPDVYVNAATGATPLVANQRASDLSGDAPEIDTSSAVLMDADGTAYIVYSTRQSVYMAKRRPSGTVVSPTLASGERVTWNADAREPSAAGDGNGNLVVVWQDYRDQNWDVFAARCSGATMTCLAATRVSTGTAAAAARHQVKPRVARNGNTVVAVWEDQRETGAQSPHVYSSISPNGGASWGPNVRVDAVYTRPTTALEPAVAIDPVSGDILAVWEQRFGGPSAPADIYAAKWNGTAWMGHARVDAAPANARALAPAIGAGAAGRFVVWEDYRNGSANADVYAARWTGSSWSEQPVSLQPAAQMKPAIAVNASVARAAWQDNRGGHWDVYAATWTGSAWGAAAQVNDNAPRASYQSFPSLAASSSGDFALVWKDNRNHREELLASRLDRNTQSWGAPTRLPTESVEWNDILRENVATAFDAAGRLHALWSEDRPSSDGPRIFHGVLSGTVWSSPVQVSDRVTHTTWSPHIQPAIASRAGRMAAAWAYLAYDQDYTWPPTYTVYASMWDAASGAWLTQTQVNAAPLRGDPMPSIALDSAGNVFVAWAEFTYDPAGQRATIRIARRPAAGGPWAQYRTVNSPLSNDAWCVQEQPELRIDANDRLHVVWTGCRAWERAVYYSRSIDGGSTWISPSVAIAPISDTIASPNLAVGEGASPELVVLYATGRTDPDGQDRYRFFAAHNITGTWQAALPVSDGPSDWRADLDGGPALAFDGVTDRFLAVFPDRRASVPQLYGAWLAAGAAACADAFEPNDGPAQAVVLPVGAAQTHAFCGDDAQDWARFDAVAGASYAIDTLNHAGVAPTLDVFLGDGISLVDSGAAITRTLGAGPHFIRARNASGTLAYDLRLRLVRDATRVFVPVVVKSGATKW